MVETIWPDARLKSFLYSLPAGDYQLMMQLLGESGEDSASWLMTGDTWVSVSPEAPLPDNTLFSYQADCVYELPSDGLE